MIAKDIAVETSKQGEKLESLDHNMADADRNASSALNELKEAHVHQKKSGKCMVFLISVIIMCLLILGFSIL